MYRRLANKGGIMMRNEYITPDIDVIVLKGRDVIVTSGDDLPFTPYPTPEEQALLDDYGEE